VLRGRFITIDGSEGAGKTTQMAFIQAYLQTLGYQVIATREPGGTSLGEAIRSVLLDHRHDGMALSSETLLMFAARAEHLERIVRPALAAGHWVLCDRFTDATYAYQGGGRGLSLEKIQILEHWVQDDLQPDLTLLLDLPVALGLERAGRRSMAADRFEKEALTFFERVRTVYLQRAKCNPSRYRIVSADHSLDAVRTEIEAILTTWLESLDG
jgi:dTMP kinase